MDLALQVVLSGPALLAVEDHEEQAGHVEGGQARAQQGDGSQDPGLGALADEGGLDEVVLGQEPGEGRHPQDGEPADTHGDPGDRHGAAQAAEAAHVDLVAHGVHDRAGPQEELGLEEAVGEQVEDGEGVADRAEPGTQHHVADLAHGGGGQDLLHVVLRASDNGTQQQGDGADDGHGRLGARGALEDGGGADHEVDARGDHGGRVDEGGHRCRAGHGVAQPGLERELGGFAAGGQQHNAGQYQYCVAKPLTDIFHNISLHDEYVYRDHEVPNYA